MGRDAPDHSDELRQTVIEAVNNSDRPIAEIAAEHHVSATWAADTARAARDGQPRQQIRGRLDALALDTLTILEAEEAAIKKRHEINPGMLHPNDLVRLNRIAKSLVDLQRGERAATVRGPTKEKAPKKKAATKPAESPLLAEMAEDLGDGDSPEKS